MSTDPRRLTAERLAYEIEGHHSAGYPVHSPCRLRDHITSLDEEVERLTEALAQRDELAQALVDAAAGLVLTTPVQQIVRVARSYLTPEKGPTDAT